MVLFAVLTNSSQASKKEEIGNFKAGLDGWEYYGGWEFKGSKGSLKLDKVDGKDCAILNGDFSGGGSYVAGRKNHL